MIGGGYWKSVTPSQFLSAMEYRNVTDAAETSNNSQTTWATKLTLTTPATLPAGEYILLFDSIWRCLNANRNADIRVVQNGVTTLENFQPFESSTNEIQLITGFTPLSNLSGANTFTLEFRVGNAAGTTIYLRNSHLILWRIA
jgi:hypothetical protein